MHPSPVPQPRSTTHSSTRCAMERRRSFASLGRCWSWASRTDRRSRRAVCELHTSLEVTRRLLNTNSHALIASATQCRSLRTKRAITDIPPLSTFRPHSSAGTNAQYTLTRTHRIRLPLDLTHYGAIERKSERCKQPAVHYSTVKPIHTLIDR